MYVEESLDNILYNEMHEWYEFFKQVMLQVDLTKE